MSNRLAHEKSPYLLQHANNPVDWFPWGDEAFARARAEDKPIFLSIGYSTCHWCHVMERESFEIEATARLLNRDFISIKVDREERPDVDRIYMAFVQATTGSGGWPMSVWLTPDLQPFVGGTYFPPDDRYGRAGFSSVLSRIVDTWKTNRAGVLSRAQEVVEALQPTQAQPGELNPAWPRTAFAWLEKSFDPEWGGFGGAPKFPRPVTLHFLLRCSIDPQFSNEEQTAALRMHRTTLRQMARGGLHDHLGGGFSRYSVDRFWHVPHFEKMLYDQAQLAIAYLEHWQRTSGGDRSSAETVRDILDYVARDLRHPAGGFYSAEDADSFFVHGQQEHGEGAFYVWSQAEINELLGADAELFGKCYGIEKDGNAPAESDPHGEFSGKNILIQRLGLARLAEQTGLSKTEITVRLQKARDLLLETRARRPRPHLDDKILTAWNGLMISAFARAGAALDEARYLALAADAAEFLWKNLRPAAPSPVAAAAPPPSVPGGDLLRSFREGPSSIPGFADDYAFLIQGLLDLYEATFSNLWLKRAVELQELQDTFFLDRENGGYFSTRADASDLISRLKDDYDGAEPSANSISALNLLRLASILDRPALHQQAGRVLQNFSHHLEHSGQGLPQMLSALQRYLAPPRQIVLAGDPAAADFRKLAKELHRRFLPDTALIAASDLNRAMPMLNGRAAAYRCENFTCQLPVTDAAEL